MWVKLIKGMVAGGGMLTAYNYASKMGVLGEGEAPLCRVDRYFCFGEYAPFITHYYQSVESSSKTEQSQTLKPGKATVRPKNISSY